MIEYPHIDSIYKRYQDGPNKGKFIEGAWTHPEFEYLASCKWRGTEKIDGMNIRICWWPHGPDIGIQISRNPGTCAPLLEFKGKTNKAQPHKPLWVRLGEIFTIDSLSKAFLDHSVCLYGEGYGADIQNGGKYIPNGVDFILFDIRIGEWWLKREDCEQLAARLGIKMVPIIGEFTLYEAINLVRHGFASLWSDSFSRSFPAEGLVLQPSIDLYFRGYQGRIITKIKTKDWILIQ